MVVDNTNPAPEDRRPLIELGLAHGARIAGYYFDSTVRECIEPNGRRLGKDRVPGVAIYATSAKLVPPSYEEGFDMLFTVCIVGDRTFEVRELDRPGPEPRDQG